MNERRQETYAIRAHDDAVEQAAVHGPLQSLTADELRLDQVPVTIYPFRATRKVRAWVRFGPVPVRVHARVVRSTPLAAGIEFRVNGTDYRCWVWGNAVELTGDAGEA